MEESTQNKKPGLLAKISIISILGLVIGALGGYFYYSEVGCVTGTCAITSNPWMSTLWGAALGYLLFDMFSGKRVKKSSDQNS